MEHPRRLESAPVVPWKPQILYCETLCEDNYSNLQNALTSFYMVKKCIALFQFILWKRLVCSLSNLEHQKYPARFQAVILVFMWCLQDGTYELNHPFDLNMYLDIVLKVVLHSAGSRKIIFSCFHPDICTMLVYKCDHNIYTWFIWINSCCKVTSVYTSTPMFHLHYYYVAFCMS